MLQVIIRMTRLAGEHKNNLKIAYTAGFFEAIAGKVPIFMILYALMQATEDKLTKKDFWIILITVLASLVIAVILRFVQEKNQSGSGYKIFARERLNLGEKIKRFPMSYFTEGNIGNLSAVITTDIKFIEEMGLSELTKIATSVIALLVTLLMLAIFSSVIALIMLITCILVALVFNKIQTLSKTHSKNVGEHQREATSAVIEYIKGMQVIKAFHLVGEKQKRTSTYYKKLSDSQYDYEKKFVPPAVLADSLISISIGIIVSVSGLALTNGTMELAMMLLLVIFAFEMYRPLSNLVNISAEIRLTEASLNRYEEVLNEKTISDTQQEVKLKNFDIEFKDVSFAYENKPVLQNISFTAREKGITALVGKSGSGKTTICNLIARFWDSSEGQILLGGVDIYEMSFTQLISNISMVFQRVYLFNDTIYNNIAFGNADATYEQVIQAAKKARCYDFIMAMPDGFDTMVREGGATLSGGEKQRISIARAILKDAPIVLLDEATSSIDPDNEHFIQQAIGELVAEKTLIVIAHKLTTIQHASQILVIDNGRVSERGTHDELVVKEGLYQQLWNKRSKAAVGKWSN
ncbi:MAG: ABC transporter ATP-binding protein [Lachnospiraceae bacterium]